MAQQEISKKYDVDEGNLEKARAAYFHPENNTATLRSFYQSLLLLAETEQKLVSSVNAQVIESLDGIFQTLDGAKRFDEKYLGHMLTEASIPAMLAYMMALRVGSNTVAEEVSRVETKLEPEAIRWIAELIGFDPETASGTFTSGGSLANTTALWVARELMSEKMGPFEVNKKGVVLASPFIHYSIDKSIKVLGGPHNMIDLVKVGSRDLAMDVDSLEQEILRAKQQGKEIMAIIAIAGETETGVTDDLVAIADLAEKYGIYLHVDAAYGLPYMMSSQAGLFEGIERANSVTFDPHKALNTPYSAGMVMFRDAEQHAKVAFKANDAPYVFKAGKASLGQKRIEGSMGAGPILSTVAAIRALSKDQWKALLDHTLNNIEMLYSALSESKVLMPVHEPDLNVLCFTLRPEFCQENSIVTNAQLGQIISETASKLWETTGYFFSTTNLPVDSSVRTLEANANAQNVYRAVLMHPRTEPNHVIEAVNVLEKLVLEEVLT